MKIHRCVYMGTESNMIIAIDFFVDKSVYSLVSNDPVSYLWEIRQLDYNGAFTAPGEFL